MPSGPEARQVPVQEAEGGADHDGRTETPLRSVRTAEENVSQAQGRMPLLEVRGMDVAHGMMDPDERAAVLSALLREIGVGHRLVFVRGPDRKGPKDWSPRGDGSIPGAGAVPIDVVVQVTER